MLFINSVKINKIISNNLSLKKLEGEKGLNNSGCSIFSHF